MLPHLPAHEDIPLRECLLPDFEVRLLHDKQVVILRLVYASELLAHGLGVLEHLLAGYLERLIEVYVFGLAFLLEFVSLSLGKFDPPLAGRAAPPRELDTHLSDLLGRACELLQKLINIREASHSAGNVGA